MSWRLTKETNFMSMTQLNAFCVLWIQIFPNTGVFDNKKTLAQFSMLILDHELSLFSSARKRWWAVKANTKLNNMKIWWVLTAWYEVWQEAFVRSYLANKTRPIIAEVDMESGWQEPKL